LILFGFCTIAIRFLFYIGNPAQMPEESNACIGATIIHDRDSNSLHFEDLDPHGPACASGLIHIGDHLVAIRGPDRWFPMNKVEDAEALLCGLPGQTVRLRIQRGAAVFDCMLEMELPRQPSTPHSGCPDKCHQASAAQPLPADEDEDLVRRLERSIMLVNRSLHSISDNSADTKSGGEGADNPAQSPAAARRPEAGAAILPARARAEPASADRASSSDANDSEAESVGNTTDDESHGGGGGSGGGGGGGGGESKKAHHQYDLATGTGGHDIGRDDAGGGGDDDDGGGVAYSDDDDDDDEAARGIAGWLPWGLTPARTRTVAVRPGRRSAPARPVVWGMLREGAAALLRGAAGGPGGAHSQCADKV
jgi:hypothetical protein